MIYKLPEFNSSFATFPNLLISKTPNEKRIPKRPPNPYCQKNLFSQVVVGHPGPAVVVHVEAEFAIDGASQDHRVVAQLYLAQNLSIWVTMGQTWRKNCAILIPVPVSSLYFVSAHRIRRPTESFFIIIHLAIKSWKMLKLCNVCNQIILETKWYYLSVFCPWWCDPVACGPEREVHGAFINRSHFQADGVAGPLGANAHIHRVLFSEANNAVSGPV